MASDSGPELPLELLPGILEYLPRASYLTKTALVNHAFYRSTIPQLYARASIYSWHKEAKIRVIQLFKTLASRPNLARYVRRLEIRDFPKNQLSEEISESILQGLRNCTNLQSCTWTRDGSLTSDILLALLHASSTPLSSDTLRAPPVPSLRELEINGHHSHLYDPKILLHFRWLTKISIIMPTVEVVQVLEEWVKILDGTLRSLNVICKMSPLITDDMLMRMAPFLKNLEFFHLTGCPKVTHKGVSAVLVESETGIVNLGLEGISPRLDLAQLLPTSITTSSPMLHNLRSLTLSIPPLHAPSALIPAPTPTSPHDTILPWSLHIDPRSPRPHFSHSGLTKYCSTLLTLLTHSTPNLSQFQIYSPHMFFEPCDATSDLFRGLIRVHGERLKRISVHRMLIGLDVIREICASCMRMEEFFVVVEPGGLEELADCVHLAKSLRTIHVNYPLEAHSEDGGVPVLHLAEALRFVQRCRSPTLTQFGCNARVWHVNRKVIVKENEDGEVVKECEVSLGPYESPDIPEQFLVVRT